MPRTPAKSPGKVYLFNCPYEEKESAKRAGAKWDASAGCWYILSCQNLEVFNRWHPNNYKYLACGYNERDDAKREGARWDGTHKQWYIDAHQDESRFARWLPSSAGKSTTKATVPKAKTKTKKRLATIPRINNDMTVAQLQTECKVRDPSIKGITTKKKDWLLNQLKIGTPWISAEDVSVDDCSNARSQKPNPTKRKTPTAAPKISKSSNSTRTKESNRTVSRINASMTAAQLQLECRARDPDIKGISNKNKTWLLEHLEIGSTWRSQGWKEEDLPNHVSTNKKQPATHSKEQSSSKKKDSTASKGKGDVRSSDASKKKASKKSVEVPAINHATFLARKTPTSAKNAPPKLVKERISHASVKNKRAIKNDPDANIDSEIQLESSKKKKRVNEDKPKANTANSSSATNKKTAPKSTTTAKVGTVSNPPPTVFSPYTRITSKMTVAQLNEEAKARQIDPRLIPKLKAKLLSHLVSGSICVHESPEYTAYQRLLNQVQVEHRVHLEASLENEKYAQARREEREQQRYEKEMERRKKELEEQEQKRKLEIAKQKSLHIYTFPRVHHCAMAKTEGLRLHGKPRYGQCDPCRCQRGVFWFDQSDTTLLYSCEKCDFDICQRCFDEENKSEAEKEMIRRKRERAREVQLRKEEEEEAREREEHKRRWDPKRFESKIIQAKGKQIDPKSGLKFTVWCSDGYDYDGWHSYEGEPTKEFDSVWSTKKEANSRAEYLFFWKNPWGLDPEEVTDENCHYDRGVVPEIAEGLKTYTVAPPDSTRWKVGVVPTDAFVHLSNSSARRHSYDGVEQMK